LEIKILPVVPVRWRDGTLIRRDSILSFEINPRWEKVENCGQKLRYQNYSVRLGWPFLFRIDLHIAKYDVGGVLRAHKDPLSHGRLWRMLYVLRQPKKGGELLSEHFIVNWPRLKIFEPSKYRHEVTEVKEGQRVVLNFGIWIAPMPNWRRDFRRINEEEQETELNF